MVLWIARLTSKNQRGGVVQWIARLISYLSEGRRGAVDSAINQ